MSFITTPEFFINMKSIPDEKSVEYEDFFREEISKINYGVVINGVRVSGWLYWHLNHWHIYKDFEDPLNHDIIRKWGNPDLRDNEWLISECLDLAEGFTSVDNKKKGLMVFGSRRLGKTEFEASYVGRSATIFEGSENLVTGGNWPDIDLITGKLDKGLSAVHKGLKFDRINDDPRKEFVLGYKLKRGERIIWSSIKIRNFDDGKNTEAAAGATAKSFLLDECGKFQFLECLNAAKPAFTSPFGWRCSPILTGTSGLFRANSDAEKVFSNPEAYNFLAIQLKGESKKYGLFIPGSKRMEGKYRTNLAGYLQTENGILIPEDSELHDIPFWNSDDELGTAVCNQERKEAASSSDSKDVLKATMYYPLNIRELFLTDDGNDFPIEAAKDHLAYLEMTNFDGEFVTLYKDANGQVKTKAGESWLKPITDLPVKKDTIKTAPIVIYEYPEPNNVPGLYIAGADPYNQGISTNSDSLGSVYIFKRSYDIVGGKHQYCIVASYVARPKSLKEWHENVELLLEYYNAVCMPENEGGTFIQYFDSKNKAHYLADGYNMLKEISPTTSVQGRLKGLPATVKVKSFWMSLMIEYCKEEIQVGLSSDGTPMTKMGVTRIPDKMLLREIISYNSTGNFDRIIAFGHVLAYENYLTKLYPVVKVKKEEETPERHTIRSPFILRNTNPFASVNYK